MEEVLCGGLAGSANVLSGYPFDTVKVRLQSSPLTYKSSLHCFQSILRTEGVAKGLFRGVTPPLIGGVLETGVNYAVYCQVLSHLTQARPPPAPSAGHSHSAAAVAAATAAAPNVADTAGLAAPSAGAPAQVPQAHMVAVAGAVAGFALSFILGPAELLKCRMQGTAGARYSGPLHCLRMGLAAEGPKFLARGFLATCAREVPGNAIFFTVYETLRHSLRRLASPAPAPGPLAASGQQHDAERGGPPALAHPSSGPAPTASAMARPSPGLHSSRWPQILPPSGRDGNQGPEAPCLASAHNCCSSSSNSNSSSPWVPTTDRQDPPMGSQPGSLAAGSWKGSSHADPCGSSSSSSSNSSAAAQGGTVQEAGARREGSGEASSTGSVLPAAASAVLSGGLSGTVMWCLVLPLDVAKTRLQTASPGSTWDIGVAKHLRMLWREGGLRALYAGLTPTLVRAFPANAAQWLVWEASTSYFREGNAGFR